MQQGNTVTAATAAVAMVGTASLRKGVPKTRETVHLCRRAIPGTPLQPLWQWSGPQASAKVYPKHGKRFTFAEGQYPERRYSRCGNGRDRKPLQRCTQNAGNGSPLQKGNTRNAATGAVATIGAASRCKGVSKRRDSVHLCNRETTELPLQPLWPRSGPQASAIDRTESPAALPEHHLTSLTPQV